MINSDIFSCPLRPWFINQLSKIENIHHQRATSMPQRQGAQLGSSKYKFKFINILRIPIVQLSLWDCGSEVDPGGGSAVGFNNGLSNLGLGLNKRFYEKK